MEVTALQKENEQLKGSIDSLQEQITLLSRQLDAKDSGKVIETVFPKIEDDGSVSISASDIMPEPEKTPAEQYLDKFGTKPHHRMLEATILKKLKEKLKE